MYGIIDIGSNTMRLSCYKIRDGKPEYVFHKKYMAGLASYINEEGRMSSKGIKKAVEILLNFKGIISSVDIGTVYVIATASFRNTVNTEEILKIIEEETGFMVQVISGEEEALCDYAGARYHFDAAEGMLADIGGGSTELVFYKDDAVLKAVSIPIGSLNMYTRHVKNLFPEKDEIKQIKNKALNELSKVNGKDMESSIIIGVGGTNRAAGKLYNDLYDADKENKVLEASRVKKLAREITKNPKEGMKKILQIVPERIHTILPGMIILNTIVKYYNADKIYVSSWGVREGYLLDKLSRGQP